jgi:sugar/nucleoside kinase (ribokinase family)
MPDAIIAGHICLDIIPNLAHTDGAFNAILQPGKLVDIGVAQVSTGGTVSNTGLALHRLGIDTRLLAKVGADPLGRTVKQMIADHAPTLVDGISASAETSTSYSIIISLPGVDHCILHHPGSNDDFTAADVRDEDIQNARLFHFGYPPLMARMFADNGTELAELFRRVKTLGLTTSLDMALPDPNSAAGRANWKIILQNTLPQVDIFLPSLDEILYMLGKDSQAPLSSELLHEVGAELLALGAKIIVIKLGERGLYLRVGSAEVLQGLGKVRPTYLTAWSNYEAWQPCYQVDMAGTTGSGDATIAGFLSAFLRDMSPAKTLQAALAVGACSVEAADPLSGIKPWGETLNRIRAGWKQKEEPQAFVARHDK